MPWKDVETERAYWQKYRTTHREEIRARGRKRWPTRSKKTAAKRSAAYLSNVDEERAKRRKNYAKHREERLAYQARRKRHKRARVLLLLLLNLDVFLARMEEIQKEQRLTMLAHKRSRRARQRNAPIIDLSAAQWAEIKAAHNRRCVYCPPDCKSCKKKTHKLTQDHVTPYTMNGSHTVWNVVPACRSCNSRKNDGPPLLPVQMLLLTIAPAKPLKKKGA